MKWLYLLLLIPINSYAIFPQLYQGYKNSDRLQEINLSREFTEIDYNLSKNKFDWNLTAGYVQSDSFLQGLFDFQNQRTIKDTRSIGVSKSSYRFGTFSFKHDETYYDLSNWTNGNAGTTYEARNTLQYSYEILNDSNRIDWDIVHLQNKATKLENKWTKDKDYLDFYNAYLNAKHKIMLDKLYKEFKSKARKRVKLMRKRVRDGLSRKVDLNQANLALLNQEEMVLKNRAELRAKIAVIEDIIKIDIPEKRYSEVNWTYKGYQQYDNLLNKSTYTETERIKLLNTIGELNLDKYDESISHSLNLSLGYAVNAFEDSRNEAFSEAFGGSEFEEKVISINYTLPLGLSNNSDTKKKIALQNLKSKLSYKNRKGQLDVQIKVLKENIRRYSRGIKLNTEKIDYAEKIVNESQKLYLRGKTSFEETLRADESLINTKISFMNMMYLYELSIAELVFLNGNIDSYLNRYKD